MALWKTQPVTVVLLPSSVICMILNKPLFIFNLDWQMTNLLNCWIPGLLSGFYDLYSWIGRSDALFQSAFMSPNLSFLVFLLFVRCAISLWWQYWFSLKASLWICLNVEIHELGRSEAWIIFVFLRKSCFLFLVWN